MLSLADCRVQYVVWQNRATRFYLAARFNYLNQLLAPAAYCGFITLELMLKATLVYHDKSFDPRHFNHNLKKLTRALRNKVPGASAFAVPAYFPHDDRFVVVSRYPSDGKGLTVPPSFLGDLDEAFGDLLVLTPFQHNTILKQLLRRRSGPERTALVQSNAQSRRIRSFLGVKQAPRDAA